MTWFTRVIVPEDCKETIFEGATFCDNSAFVDSHYDRVTDIARCQMKSVQSGAQAAKWKAHKDKYGMIKYDTLYTG